MQSRSGRTLIIQEIYEHSNQIISGVCEAKAGANMGAKYYLNRKRRNSG
jgi:hypothetical protein